MEKQLILNDDSTAVMGFPFDAVLKITPSRIA